MSSKQRLGLSWIIMGMGWTTIGLVQEWPLSVAIGIFMLIMGLFLFL